MGSSMYYFPFCRAKATLTSYHNMFHCTLYIYFLHHEMKGDVILSLEAKTWALSPWTSSHTSTI